MCIVWVGGDEYKRWPEHKYMDGKYDGKLAQFCSRCGVHKVDSSYAPNELKSNE